MKTSNEYVQMVRTCLNGSRIKKQGNWRLGFRGQPIRAERAKAKSCKDDMIIAQGKRSAALGYGRNMIPSFFPSGFARPWRVTLEGKKEVGWLGSLPRAAASATLPWAIIMLPLRGAGGRENCRLGSTNRPSFGTLSLAGCRPLKILKITLVTIAERS
ncbi:MAG: hypothetical protein NT167_11495 [Verrucomicrobia bacterium]|nr:hypothetical protein [Verrucomicrobiota bacterium]